MLACGQFACERFALNLGLDTGCEFCFGDERRARLARRLESRLRDCLPQPAAIWWPCPMGLHRLELGWPDPTLPHHHQSEGHWLSLGPCHLVAARKNFPGQEQLAVQVQNDLRELWQDSGQSEIHYCLTRDLRVLYCSPSYERLLGASLRDLWCDTSSFLGQVHPGDREGLLTRMHRLSEVRSGLCTQVFRAGQGGQWRWFSARSHVLDEFILGQCGPVPVPQGHWSSRLADWEQSFEMNLAFGAVDWTNLTIQWVSPRGRHQHSLSLSAWGSSNPTQLELPGLAAELAGLLPDGVGAVYALPGHPVPGLLACSRDAPILPGLARICAWTLEEPDYCAQPERMAELRDQLWKSVARELHDELGQLLTACKLQTQLLEGNRPTAQKLNGLLDQALDGTRRVAWRLRSMQLEPEDFLELARRRAREIEHATGFRISIQDRLPHHRLPAEHQATLGQIAQECLTNCLRHSQAQTIEVACWAESDWLHLRVGDDGQGCGLPLVAGMGLTGIAERLELLGGCLSIESSPSNGFQLTASLPWFPT